MKISISLSFLYVLFLTLISTSIVLVSGMTNSQEIKAIYVYAAHALSPQNQCVPNLPGYSPCMETDSGYDPSVQAAYAGLFEYLEPTIINSGTIAWLPPSNNNGTCSPTSGACPNSPPPICMQTSETCKDNTTLYEATCCNNIPVGSPPTYQIYLSGQIHLWWPQTTPATLTEVDCLAYAANRPQLGLQGICQAGRCI